MHVRIELPIEKPLRRGGYISNMDGDRCWVSFKYERLPTFCFSCGKLGHDEKHCGVVTEKQSMEKKYGDWLRVGSMSKGPNEGLKELGKSRHGLKTDSFRGSGSGGHESKIGDDMGKTVQATVGEMEVPVRVEGETRNSWGGRVSLEGWERAEKPKKLGLVARAERDAASHQGRCDNARVEKQEESKGNETHSTPRQTRSQLVGDLSKTKGEEKAIWMGLAREPKLKEGGAAVPLKPKMNTIEKEEVSSLKPKETKINNSEEEGQAGPKKGKNRTGKGNLKKVAREVGKARGVGSSSLEIAVGTKRRKDTNTFAEREG